MENKLEWGKWHTGKDGIWVCELRVGPFSATIYSVDQITQETGYNNRMWAVMNGDIAVAGGYTMGSGHAFELCELVLKHNGVLLEKETEHGDKEPVREGLGDSGRNPPGGRRAERKN